MPVWIAGATQSRTTRTRETHLARIGHVQIADNPGRHEPGTGELNFPFLFRHLDRIGYRGHIGCEYRPAGRTEDGLAWLETVGASSGSREHEAAAGPTLMDA
jgi:hydroxypyruvate isomerase